MRFIKFLVAITLTVLLTGSLLWAETIEAPKLNLPNMQAGIVYSAENEEFKACTTATLLGYPTKIGTLELRGGYILDKEPMGALCFKLGDLTQFGFEMPLHHLINVSVGGYAGYIIDEKEADYGIVSTIMEVKF